MIAYRQSNRRSIKGWYAEYLLTSYHSNTPKATIKSLEVQKMSGKKTNAEKEKWLELLQRILERATAEQVKDIYIFALFSKY